MVDKQKMDFRLLSCGGGPIGGRLLDQYATQVAMTGADTTPEDAFAAWLRWLQAEGGRPERPLTLDDCNRTGFHTNVAKVIREMAAA